MDMLVKLYELPTLSTLTLPENIKIRRAKAAEKHIVSAWVEQIFEVGWRSEVEVAYARQPIAVFIAVQDSKQIIGFAAYDATLKGFFGPMGVDPAAQAGGIGRALVLHSLHDMYANGYGYAIIGGVGPAKFYEKTVGAVAITDSEPGVYAGMLTD